MQGAASDSVKPVFEVGILPGEGIAVFEAVAHTLIAYEQPVVKSDRPHAIRVAPGERLSYDAARYQTIVPGPIRVLVPAAVAGRMLGAITHLTRDEYYRGRFQQVEIQLDTADRLELLQHRAEGTCFVRYTGEVIDARPCPVPGNEAFFLERQPVTRRWIHVRSADGPGGWVEVVDSLVKEAGRAW